ncbi:hypothetical protein QAD02_015545 [Eretmocerus hayati]|uniref:Uncharacterized protein n=1 Tax=Eretmocerus hayati TaxID=131215 RepID=A0ACC2P9J3_9HYME|nr:hypothetical protein QAD02_015545 [Eretmocerus hayati]
MKHSLRNPLESKLSKLKIPECAMFTTQFEPELAKCITAVHLPSSAPFQDIVRWHKPRQARYIHENLKHPSSTASSTFSSFYLPLSLLTLSHGISSDKDHLEISTMQRQPQVHTLKPPPMVFKCQRHYNRAIFPSNSCISGSKIEAQLHGYMQIEGVECSVDRRVFSAPA